MWFCLLLGTGLLGASGWSLLEGRVFALRVRAAAGGTTTGSYSATSAIAAPHAAILPDARPAAGLVWGSEVLGRIEVPACGIAAVIVDGIDGKSLRRGVGHIPGTARPGERGNIGLAAHRDTFFRGLRHIALGDTISIMTSLGSNRYRVDWTCIVDPERVELLSAGDDSALTLVTCYPFGWIGPAPRRFVVRARQCGPGVGGVSSSPTCGTPPRPPTVPGPTSGLTKGHGRTRPGATWHRALRLAVMA